MVYINVKSNGKVETIDDFETYKESKAMLKEYRLASDYYNNAYLSQRCCNDWK